MMKLVVDDQGLRFQREYGDTLTVLEGEELQCLLNLYFQSYDAHSDKDKKTGKAFVSAVIQAYQKLYYETIVTEGDLQYLSTADARKMDLLYRGLLALIGRITGSEKDFEKQLSPVSTFMSILNEIIQLKPNVFSLGVDLNALIRKELGVLYKHR